MHWMEIKRRTFLKGSLGLISFHLGNLPLGASTPSTTIFANALANSQREYFLQLFDQKGNTLLQIPLPGRGHSIAFHQPSQQLVVFARRPGTFVNTVSLEKLEMGYAIKSSTERHFYGHGVFSNDGRWLFTSENNYNANQGVIGVYDTKDHYKRVDEFSSFGIGPHEIGLLSNGKVLVVANGGIQTHPNFGRQKLNLGTMDSSLVYIDLQTKKLLGAYRLPPKLQKMSLRHLIVTPKDEVALAMQYQGARTHLYPLVGIHDGENSIQLMEAPFPVNRQMKNYCGSIAIDSSGDTLAVSSPRGHLVTFWSVLNRNYLGKVVIEDGCGVAPGSSKGVFLISSGTGKLFQSLITVQKTIQLKRFKQTSVQWDNHMVSLKKA